MLNTNQQIILIHGAEGASDTLECMLKGSGYKVVRTDDREELLQRLQAEDTVLLLYDFHTKSGSEADALAFLGTLRKCCNKPILTMAAKDREMLRILALNAGADDALNKECSPMEALARIQAQIRCYKRLQALAKKSHSLRIKELEVDDAAKIVTVRGDKVDLTPTEYKILYLLLQHPGRVMSNSEIYEQIWNMAPIGANNIIAVHIRHIREKIEKNPQEPQYLQVVWGQGYRVG